MAKKSELTKMLNVSNSNNKKTLPFAFAVKEPVLGNISPPPIEYIGCIMKKIV